MENFERNRNVYYDITANSVMKHSRFPAINRSANAGPVWYPNYRPELPITEQRSEYTIPKWFTTADFSPKLKYVISNIPFDNSTEHRDNYLNFKHRYPINFLRRQDLIQLSKLPMESETIYNNEYKAKDNAKTMPIKPPVLQINLVFDINKDEPRATSIYKSDFQLCDKDNTNERVATVRENRINNQEAQTDYQLNFNKKILTREYLPYPTYKKPNVPFAMDTSYNSTFVKHPYSKEPMILPKKTNLHFSDLPFGCLSQYKSNFVDKERNIKLDNGNVYQNPSSLMHKVSTANWYDNYPSQQFGNRSNPLFCQK